MTASLIQKLQAEMCQSPECNLGLARAIEIVRQHEAVQPDGCVPIEKKAILTNLGDLKDAWETLRPYVNDTPELISLLYDLDLMPEQIHVRRNFIRMMQLAEWHKHYRSTERESGDAIREACKRIIHDCGQQYQPYGIMVKELDYAAGRIDGANSVATQILGMLDETEDESRRESSWPPGWEEAVDGDNPYIWKEKP